MLISLMLYSFKMGVSSYFYTPTFEKRFEGEHIVFSLSFLWQKWQGSHRLEKYLNLESLLEKSLKIKSALESIDKSLKGLEKSLNSTIFFRTQHC